MGVREHTGRVVITDDIQDRKGSIRFQQVTAGLWENTRKPGDRVYNVRKIPGYQERT
jgi:hypothetical protein